MKNEKFVSAVYRMFKAFPADIHDANNNIDTAEYLEKYGVYVTEKAKKNVSDLEEKIGTILPRYGIVMKNMNQTFHKSFEVVRDSSMEQLVFQQVMHYMTTYGAKHMGVFDEALVYIPNEEIGLSNDGERVFVNVISVLETPEIRNKITALLESGVALSADTIEDIFTIIDHCKFSIDVDKCKNKEVRVIFCDRLNVVPSNPIEFLRLMIYKATGSTLIIKNKDSFEVIRFYMMHNNGTNAVTIHNLMNKYIAKYNINTLASIFLRYKMLFLAFKCGATKKTINSIRRLAEKNHKPMKEKILDIITSGKAVDLKELKKELNNVTLFKKVSLINAILYRESANSNGKKPFVYKIRNGKMFAMEKDDTYKPNSMVSSIIINSIVTEVNEKIAGKKIYLPNVIDFAFPTSEKNFVGGIPNGSIYTFKDSDESASIVGVHWNNVMYNGMEHQIDIDLHYSSMTESIGWDSSYRNKSTNTFFSGDMTYAPIDRGGASEFLYIEDANDENGYMFTLNHYNRPSAKVDIPYEIVMGNTTKMQRGNYYDNFGSIATHQNLELVIPMMCKNGDNLIGYFNKNDEGKKQFTFVNYNIGSACSYRMSDYKATFLKYMRESVNTQLKLKTILDLCDIEYVSEASEADIVLDYQSMGATTILDMLVK